MEELALSATHRTPDRPILCDVRLRHRTLAFVAGDQADARRHADMVIGSQNVGQGKGCGMSFGFTRRPSPAQQRRNKARRLVNLSVHEVSSVDSGAGMGCEVKLMKHAPRGGLGVDETEKMNMDLNTAYRVSKLMSLDKVFNDHSAGKIDGALMSEGIRKLADAEFPNDKLA